MDITHECGFELAWSGPCKTKTDVGYCEEHLNLKCQGCGAPAVRQCEHTGIQFVCGVPLCRGCDHGPPPQDGKPNWFGLGGEHKPAKETYLAWAAYWTDGPHPDAGMADAYRKMALEVDKGEQSDGTTPQP